MDHFFQCPDFFSWNVLEILKNSVTSKKIKIKRQEVGVNPGLGDRRSPTQALDKPLRLSKSHSSLQKEGVVAKVPSNLNKNKITI